MCRQMCIAQGFVPAQLLSTAEKLGKRCQSPAGCNSAGLKVLWRLCWQQKLHTAFAFPCVPSGRGGRCGREPTRAAGAVRGPAPERPELAVPQGGSAGRGLRGSSRTAAARAAPPPPRSLRCSDLRSCCWQGALWREGSCLALISQLLLEVGSWLRRSRRSREVRCSG